MKKSNILLIFCLMLSYNLLAASLPPFSGFTLGITRAEALKKADSLAALYGSLTVKDSNTILIHTDKSPFPDLFAVVSIKCMFNKKKTIQALNITCKAENVFQIEKIVGELVKLVGNPDQKESAIGFATELEWNKGSNYKCYLFSSEKSRECYFLFATPSFMKEEMGRSGSQ
jgi:hypothetical protein